MLAGLVCGWCVMAQNWFSVGVTGGVPLTDPFADRSFSYIVPVIQPFGLPPLFSSLTTRTYTGSKDFVAGPMIEVGLPFGLAAEAVALYRPMTLNAVGTTIPSRIALAGSTSSTRIDTWEFPVLAKYRLPLQFMSPHVYTTPYHAVSNRNQLEILAELGTAPPGLWARRRVTRDGAIVCLSG
jgi:hypothetical protein